METLWKTYGLGSNLGRARSLGACCTESPSTGHESTNALNEPPRAKEAQGTVALARVHRTVTPGSVRAAPMPDLWRA